jgi:hypothetical protein
MYNIIKIEGGFVYNDTSYQFIDIDGQYYQVISNEQVHVYTDFGIILLDLSCSIDDEYYEDIDSFISALYM